MQKNQSVKLSLTLNDGIIVSGSVDSIAGITTEQQLMVVESANSRKLDILQSDLYPITVVMDVTQNKTDQALDAIDLTALMNTKYRLEDATPWKWDPIRQLLIRNMPATLDSTTTWPIIEPVETQLAGEVLKADFMLVVDENDNPIRFWTYNDNWLEFEYPIVEFEGERIHDTEGMFSVRIHQKFDSPGAGGWGYGFNHDYQGGKVRVHQRVCRALFEGESPEVLQVKLLGYQRR